MSEKFRRTDFQNLPETIGLFCFFDKNENAIFAGAAKNLRTEIDRILKSEKQFSANVAAIEILQTTENLPRELARLIRQKEPRFNFRMNEATLYPHLKITAENFPRLLVTRRILNERDEYFGAFLPRTGVRIWLYVLNKIFKLRSCELDIRGDDQPQPCVMFREKRCLAPCVESLCDAQEYAESVELLKLFLRRDQVELKKILINKIENLAKNLEFERAARWRDFLNSIENIFADKKLNLWLEDAVDTVYLEIEADQKLFHIVTTRGRRTLGYETYIFPATTSDDFALSQILWQFYQFHAPREIRLTRDFSERKFFAEALSRQARRKVKITLVAADEFQTAFFSFKRSKLDLELKRLSNLNSVKDIAGELQKIFGLAKEPERIEAFDVAHISNEDFVAASAVWQDGELSPNNARFWILDSENEPQALAEAVRLRLSELTIKPDLILLDGGRSQLNAVAEILNNANVKIIAAVKPSGKHNEISHFLIDNGTRIDFESKPVFEILRNLRDEAHALANQMHRQKRELKIFAANMWRENLAVVPIRFDESGGAAENFRLISNVHPNIFK